MRAFFPLLKMSLWPNPLRPILPRCSGSYVGEVGGLQWCGFAGLGVVEQDGSEHESLRIQIGGQPFFIAKSAGFAISWTFGLEAAASDRPRRGLESVLMRPHMQGGRIRKYTCPASPGPRHSYAIGGASGDASASVPKSVPVVGRFRGTQGTYRY